MRWLSSSRLRSPVDRDRRPGGRARSAALRRATWTSAGSWRKPRGERADLVRERRREQQVLAARRQQREDLADVADEAHVEHPVGLVEDEDLDRARGRSCPAPTMVEQAAGRRDDDLGAGAERADLGVEADAAVDRRSSGRGGARRRSGRSPRPGARARGSGSRTRHADRQAGRVRGDRGRSVGRRDAGRLSALRSWRIGSTKAAVLPVPVWAPARRSRPASTSGMASRLDGRGLGVALGPRRHEGARAPARGYRRTWESSS